ncbi:PREDICTED: chymotrypsin-2-like [Ceratosolen solmsi marchali]|uniref:Chymotrypsin-2-like n=1 Tax=Ceratosolen solmsi marchali TaxID=326594 RepID=A0AAJ6YWK5_9HYME|nr:PREDICTED: chymotrypsin-2-like [Ceratosolen solmsi marchali]
MLICFFLLLSSNSLSKFTRIIGGNDADLEKYPYMVSIRTVNGEGHYCGGTIISNRHIISAAHCFDKYHHSELKVFTGSILSTSDKPNYRILDVNIHPKYTGIISRLSTLYNDIAVATVDRCIEFNQFQNKINFPSKNIENEANGKIIGWGMTHYPGKISEILQEASVSILNNTECAKFVPLAIHDGQICAFQSVGVGTCVGDSGGPLVSSNGEFVGIGSFMNLCALGEPDIFIRVYYFIEFIKDVMSATYFPSCSIS